MVTLPMVAYYTDLKEAGQKLGLRIAMDTFWFGSILPVIIAGGHGLRPYVAPHPFVWSFLLMVIGIYISLFILAGFASGNADRKNPETH